MIKRCLHEFLHCCRVAVIYIVKVLMVLIPKNNHLIVFTSWFGKKYADNSRFVFEYMLNHYPDYSIFWYVTDKLLYQDLKKKGLPVIYSKTLYAVWKQIRAKVLVGSIDLSEYNPYFLSGCVFFNLAHGHIIKNPGDIVNNKRTTDFYLLLRKGIDYYSIVCVAKRPFQDVDSNNDITEKLGKKKVLTLGFARNDMFYNPSLRMGLNENIKQIAKNKILISYLPTHRSDGKNPIHINSIMDLKEIDRICEEYNAVFIIKKHFYHRFEKEEVSEYKNIFDFTDDMSIDTQELLYETSILISDYSACFVDYLLLDRPIVLYQYDYEHFKNNERDFLIPFDKVKISSYPKNKIELNKELKRILNNSLLDGFSEGRRLVRNEYFDEGITNNVSERVASLIIKKSQESVNREWQIKQ